MTTRAAAGSVLIGWLWVFASLSAVMGCAGRTSLHITSGDSRAVLSPHFITAVYSAKDNNTADLFLSDLPPDQVVGALALSARGRPATPGVIVHLHLFLMPDAGRTPIAFTASNVSINQVIVSGAGTGIYGGAGFFLPSTSVGDPVLKGALRGATIRLVHADAGFADQLGPAHMDGTIAARRNDALAEQIGAQMIMILSRR